MAPIPPIFTLPVPAYKSKTHNAPEGSFTLTQPFPKVYLLTFNSPPDNRLTPPFLDTFRLALDITLTTLPPGVLVTTSAIPKFYSNGLDYGAAIADPAFMTKSLYPLWRALLTFPWPTVAVINGHSFAGGLMTAMAHDYRIMNPHKGYLCLNELDFNAPLTPAMSTLFRNKLSMSTFRAMVLEGKRFSALTALEAGIVDSLGGLEEAAKFIKEMGIDGKVRELGVGSYGLIKEEMYRDIIQDLDRGLEGERYWDGEKKQRRNEILAESKKAVEKWKNDGGKLGGNVVKSKL